MVNNIPVNGWPQLKDLEAVQPILNRLDKIEAWKRTVKEETFTGDDITIENALALPARSLITEINAIQEGEGDPSPTNIRPISGRDSVAVKRTSANYVTEYLNGSNIIADGSIVSNEQYSLALMPVKQGETYTASHNTESYWVWAFYRSKPTIGSGSYNNDRTLDTISASKTFTAPIDGYIAIRVPVAYRELMVNGGSTALPYEPSYATDFTIQLGTTVYGAEINWDTGVMTVNKASGDTTITKIYQRSGNANCDFAVFRLPDGILYRGNMSKMQCDKGYYSNAVNFDSAILGCILAYDSHNHECAIAMPKGYTLEQAQSYYGTIQICDVLATPTTIQLTPSQLEMLKGYNHITLSDGYGTIELKALTGANWS